MKIALRVEQGVAVLAVSGPVSTENFKVLKAGITKLLKDGKNKVILELHEWNDFTTEIIRDLAQLNLIAQELSGKIVLSQVDPTTKTKVTTFATPQVLETYEKTSDAVVAFIPPKKEEIPTTPPPATPAAAPKTTPAPTPVPTAPAPTPATAPATAPAAKSADVKNEVDQLKAELKKLETTGLSELRKENDKLKAENVKLHEEFRKMFMERKLPANEKAFAERIAALETQLKEALDNTVEQKK